MILLWASLVAQWTSLVAQMVKASACNAGDPGSIPGLGRLPGEGNGNPIQYSCLENPTDGGAWRICLQSGRPEFDSWFGKIPLEKGKATHSSILAWRILYSPWGLKESDMTEQTSLHFNMAFKSLHFKAPRNQMSVVAPSSHCDNWKQAHMLPSIPWETVSPQGDSDKPASVHRCTWGSFLWSKPGSVSNPVCFWGAPHLMKAPRDSFSLEYIFFPRHMN